MSMEIVQILTGPFALALLAYIVLVATLAFAVHPMRREMILLGEELLADPALKPRHRDAINLLMDTCMSFRVGLLLPVAVLSVLADEVLKREVHVPGDDSLMNDPRFDRFLTRHILSIAAINPIATAIAMVLMIPTVAYSFAIGRDRTRAIVEEPLLRASATMTGRAQCAA